MKQKFISPLSGESVFILVELGKSKCPQPITLHSPTPWAPGTRPVVPLTCNPDIIDGDHFIQLQQELLGKGGQAGYEKSAIFPGEFLSETWGFWCCRERSLPLTAG